jgi:hypothetical protein
MRRSGSYAPFVRAAGAYRSWTDLSQSGPQPVPVSPESFDRLAADLGDSGGYTDLLLT